MTGSRRSAYRALFLVTALLSGLVPASLPRADAAGSTGRCVDGRASTYTCRRIDLRAFLPLSEMTGGDTSDVWGWRDPKTKNEYALVGTSSGLAFVDVTKPEKPKFLGNLPKPDRALIWQDVEVYKNHAFVVCDLSPCGMQIFDLTKLRGIEQSQTWVPDLVYPLSPTTHTIDINQETGFAYLNGNLALANGAPQILDVSEPKRPVPVGVIADDGYTHDSLCRIYRGPDKNFHKKEVCFNFNEDTITVYDVTDKVMPAQITKVTYEGVSYTHWGALTKDHRYLLSNDEGDEQAEGSPSTIYIWDVRALKKMKLIGKYRAGSKSIDHNVYMKGRYAYHASYTAGVRILDTARVARGKLREVAYFDVMPLSDAAAFDGTWAAYPYLPSGNVLVTGMSQGLFIVRPRL